jgi:hypothetical protein
MAPHAPGSGPHNRPVRHPSRRGCWNRSPTGPVIAAPRRDATGRALPPPRRRCRCHWPPPSPPLSSLAASSSPPPAIRFRRRPNLTLHCFACITPAPERHVDAPRFYPLLPLPQIGTKGRETETEERQHNRERHAQIEIERAEDSDNVDDTV